MKRAISDGGERIIDQLAARPRILAAQAWRRRRSFRRWSTQARLRGRGWRRSTRACCASAGSCAWTMRPGGAGRRATTPAATPPTAPRTACTRLSPTFAALARALDRARRRVSRARSQFDLTGRALAMTDCWVNIMGRGAAHGLHLHPLSTISGTYYVAVPPRCAGTEVRGPAPGALHGGAAARSRAHAAPTDRGCARRAQPAELVLFESWLRHEVPANPAAAERISISFNYSWF